MRKGHHAVEPGGEDVLLHTTIEVYRRLGEVRWQWEDLRRTLCRRTLTRWDIVSPNPAESQHTKSNGPAEATQRYKNDHDQWKIRLLCGHEQP